MDLNKIIREELKKTLNEGKIQSVESKFASQIDDIMMTWHDYESEVYDGGSFVDDEDLFTRSKVELLNLIYQAIEGNSSVVSKIKIR